MMASPCTSIVHVHVLVLLFGVCLTFVSCLGPGFTLKRYGRTVPANSVLDISRIGREYQSYSWYYRPYYSNEGPLVCRTNITRCCRDVDDPIDNEENGEWFYPNGQVVGSSPEYGKFYVTRGRQELYLHSYSARTPTGVYCCDVQTVNSTGNITAEYVSDTNFTSVNSSVSNCVGLYTSRQIQRCREFSVSNGWVEYDSPYIPGRVASISCRLGYSLVGDPERICTSNGWSGRLPSCVYDCGSLSDPLNGVVDTSEGTTVGQTATYSCNKGYRLIGSSRRYCRYYSWSLSASSWSNSAPICVDEARLQLKFSPTSDNCLKWESSKVNSMTRAFVNILQQVLVDYLPIVLPGSTLTNFTHSPLSSERGFFSCRHSSTHAHFRTTLVGLEDVSAHDMVKAVQSWVSEGPSVRMQWYVVDIDKDCPVAISSDVAPECVTVDSDLKECLEQCVSIKAKLR